MLSKVAQTRHEVYFVASALLLLNRGCSVIRRQSRHSRFTRFEQPHSPPVKIPDQFLVLVPHILRPDDVGSINVSPVVDPLVNRIVAGTVANDDEMLAACMLAGVPGFRHVASARDRYRDFAALRDIGRGY